MIEFLGYLSSVFDKNMLGIALTFYALFLVVGLVVLFMEKDYDYLIIGHACIAFALGVLDWWYETGNEVWAFAVAIGFWGLGELIDWLRDRRHQQRT